MGVRLFLIFLVLKCGYLFAQNEEIDSIQNLLLISNDSSALASAHGRLAWLMMYNDLDAAFAHNDTSMTYYLALSDHRNIAISHYKYGVLHRVRGNFDSAIYSMRQYKDFVSSEKDTFGLANSLFQIGVIHSKKADFEKALRSYFDALSIYERRGDSTAMGFTLNSIGIVYKNLQKYDEAKETFLQVVDIHKKKDDKSRLADAYHNLATVFHQQKEYENALTYYAKANQLNDVTNNQWGKAINYNDIGGVLMEQGQYGEASRNFRRAYDIQLENNYTDDMGLTLANLGEAYFKSGDNRRAEDYLQEGLNRTTSKKILRELHYNLFELYEHQGFFPRALENHKTYVKLNDSILNEKNLESINALQVKYESEKKDKALINQKLQLRETENQLLKTQSQKRLALGGGIIILFLGLGVWFYFQQRQRLRLQEISNLKSKQEVLKLESLIQGEEKERVRLAQDLHDGINGDLAVIKYKISSLDPKKFKEKERSTYKEALSMLDNAVEQIRRISHNLAPPALQNFELEEAIRQYCSKVASANPKLQIDFQYFGEKLSLDKETETALYRMVQELITNVVKHANASEAIVQINHRDQILHITVEDNGSGFDATVESPGIGMQNTRSRVHYLKGEMDIDSGTEGTTVQIHIDLENISSK